jgi:hypothetical protein
LTTRSKHVKLQALLTEVTHFHVNSRGPY